jgi:lysophospholipase L1-like esterase
MPIEVINAGIGANVISTNSPAYTYSGKPAGSERLGKHVIDRQPDLLIISYGLNDARGGTPLELFCQEMKKIVLDVRQQIQPLIVLLGPYYMYDFHLGAPYWDKGSLEVFRQYNLAIKEVAQACKCLFVDLLESYQEADWLVHRDGVHANDVGHRVVANKVFEVLVSNCSGLSLETKALEDRIPPWRDESTLQADYGYTSGDS